MYIKDSLPEDVCTVKQKAILICKGLGISKIQIMPQLETESSCCCITEAYRFIAQLLEGKYKNGFSGIPYRVYNVTFRKYETETFILW